MHRLRHLAPALDLRGVVEARDIDIAAAGGVRRGALGDDQPRAGALGVVFGIERIGGLTRAAVAPSSAP